MRVILRRIVQWILKDSNDDPLSGAINPVKSSPNVSYQLYDSPAISFSIINASGGKVIIVKKTSRSSGSLPDQIYVVPENDDLMKELGFIIMREGLQD